MISAPGTLGVRPASTLLLVRDTPVGLEVLMVKRSERSSFLGGVYVFPGGGVDELDASAAIAARCTGRSDAEASARLGLASGGLAVYVSAIRELFEESGILLATTPDGSAVSLAGELEARVIAHRAAINARRATFPELLELEELTLDLGALEHHAHWITPTSAAKRFDTYFFVAAAPPDQVPLHDEGETVAAEWVTPADALARHRRGEIEMVLPTMRNLAFVARHATVAALLVAAAALGEIPTILPRMVDTEEGPTLLVPGDPGYVELPGAPDDPAKFPEATRRRAAAEHHLGG